MRSSMASFDKLNKGEGETARAEQRSVPHDFKDTRSETSLQGSSANITLVYYVCDRLVPFVPFHVNDTIAMCALLHR